MTLTCVTSDIHCMYRGRRRIAWTRARYFMLTNYMDVCHETEKQRRNG